MVKVTVFVEGGSRGNLATECRKGFRKFFENAGLRDHMPSIVACGNRNDALDRFCVALSDSPAEEIPFLLVDSEAPVKPNTTSWQHLSIRDSWKRPDNAQDDQAHLMVQCMESWFVADISALETFFGAGFRPPAKRDNVEVIPKQDVLGNMEASSQQSKKGAYHKGRHSFDILAHIDPAQVTQRSPFARQLIDTLKAHLIPT